MLWAAAHASIKYNPTPVPTVFRLYQGSSHHPFCAGVEPLLTQTVATSPLVLPDSAENRAYNKLPIGVGDGARRARVPRFPLKNGKKYFSVN